MPLLLLLRKPNRDSAQFSLWIGISCILFLHNIGRAFVLPASIMLLGYSTPHPSLLATVNGVGQSVAAIARTLGLLCAGILHGLAMHHGFSGMVWFANCGFAFVGFLSTLFLRNDPKTRKAMG
jgi:hypothetical protein